MAEREITSEELAVSAQCRDLRHAWDAVGDTVLIEEKGQVKHFARTLECYRCETLRIDEYKISAFALTKVRTRYTYIPGYHIKGGIKVAELRFRLFSNIEMVPSANLGGTHEALKEEQS